MDYPEFFLKRMNCLLGEGMSDFLRSFEDEPEKAVQLRSQQTDETLIFQNCPNLTPIRHLNHAAYFDGDKIGAHPYHHAGIFYSQDPAAMLPAGWFPINPDALVLDVCAAPGGKTSQIAAALEQGSGFLVANEIHPGRNKILLSNLERLGLKNVLATRLEAQQLAETYPGFFDLVLVDAPCSGEGMFRKYPESVQEWSLENIQLCSERQKEILSYAADCVKPGGFLIYSTCTYAVEEDEAIVSWLLDRQDFLPYLPKLPAEDITCTLPKEMPAEFPKTFSAGPGVFKSGKFCHRFYPHTGKGEGQFFCYLQKKGDSRPLRKTYGDQLKLRGLKPASVTAKNLFFDALSGQLNDVAEALYQKEDRLYLIPALPVPLPAYGITKLGIPAGELCKNRFQPHHNLFRAYGHLFENKLSYSVSDIRLSQYLNGQELQDDRVRDGFGVLCVDGTPIGGFKASKGRLKNHYPKALRNPSLFIYDKAHQI